MPGTPLSREVTKQLKTIHVSLSERMETELKAIQTHNDEVISKLEEQRKEDLVSITKLLDSMTETLKPIAKTYDTVSTLGKWSMATILFLSILLGVITGVWPVIKALILKFFSIAK